ncbi:hypothetical protein ID866_3285 [Astraeus odoratus]|nr:hypothetical protein ID866_3285 [Astraeus odoratus]
MAAPDARTRRKISLQPTKVLSVSLNSGTFPGLLASNVLFVLALFAAKEWLFSYEVGVFWVVMRVLAIGGLSMLLWEAWNSKLSQRGGIEWTALGLSSFLLFMQQAALYTTLYRLSSVRVILFTHFSASWVGTTLSHGSLRKPMAIVSAFALSFLSDVAFSNRSPRILLPGYGCLVLHGLITYALEYVRGTLSPVLSPSMTTAASSLGAAVLALPFYAFRQALLNLPPSPVLPLLSLAVLPLLTYAMVFLTPDTDLNQYHPSQAAQVFLLTYPSAFLVAVSLGYLGFSQHPGWTDLLIATILYYVQMLYGVWTNSLGLISDAIHMAFDCMAIGVGLFASIMAKWPPNERFTYGYGRTETLSGFANGIFLILISIFIVFEAIQRILDPPEMTTSQLLLVSSVGLGVNLFDTLGSVGVIISTLLIQYYGWTGFDPIASIFIAILIAASVVPLVIDTGRVLSLDLGDNESTVQQALMELSHVEGVASYSSPRFWPKDSTSIIGSIRIQLTDLTSHDHPQQSHIDQVLERVNGLLRSRIPGLEEVTIQLEKFGSPSST